MKNFVFDSNCLKTAKIKFLKPKLICVRCKDKPPVLLFRYGTKKDGYSYKTIPVQTDLSQERFDLFYPDAKIEIIPGKCKLLFMAETGTLYQVEG